MEFDDVIEKFEAELKIDLKIDRHDLATDQIKVLPIRQKWAARLTHFRANLQKLKNKRESVKDDLIVEYINNSKVNTPNRAVVSKAVERDNRLTKIYDDIDKTDLMIQYLTEVVDMCKSKHFAIGNLIEINKLEYA